MVAVVSGNGLGLDNGSLSQLGQALGGQAGIGQAGAGQYVNVATGNLVLSGRDEGLVFDGTVLDVLRTYNSRGDFAGGHGWSYGFSRAIGGLTGTRNTAGSTVVRTADDGSQVTYVYDADRQAYVSHGQGGTEDLLTWTDSTSTWTWVDGKSRQTETYGVDGHLARLVDARIGAAFVFAYENGRLATVTADDGDALGLSYDSQGRLVGLAVTSMTDAGPVTRQGVTYGYDALGRLISATTTLGATAGQGAATYAVNYAYDGDSDRIASMTQSDGTTVSYTYAQSGGQWRVVGIVVGGAQDAQALSIAYTDAGTTITDALGHAWTYKYDQAGQLLAVTSPDVDGVAATQAYTYDDHGNLTSITDATGGVTRYTYDSHGNVLTVVSPGGDTVRYTYTAHNQIASRTEFAFAATADTAASRGATTYYLYDASDRLAYTADAFRVTTRYVYAKTAGGQSVLASVIQYRDVGSPMSNWVTPDSPPATSDFDNWIKYNGPDSQFARSIRTDYTYDVRGQLLTQTRWDTVDASGNGVTTAGTEITVTTYDASGRLVQSGMRRGDRIESTSYAYDGLGRLLSSTDPTGAVTSYLYLDGGHSIQVTQADGRVSTRAYDSAGRLISTIESAVDGSVTARRSRVVYDAAGNTIATIDGNGDTTYYFHDAAGRTSARVAPGGAVTSYRYDADGRIASEVAYATTLSTAGWLIDGRPGTAYPSVFQAPASSPDDRRTDTYYDADGHIAASIDPSGIVTTYAYDGRGLQISTHIYATMLDDATRASLGDHASLASLNAVLKASSADAITRVIYNEMRWVSATVDAAGYVTFYRYDLNGYLFQKRLGTVPFTADQWAAQKTDQPTPSDLFNLAARGDDLITWYASDAMGRRTADVDPEGFVTTYTYDEVEHTVTTSKYARPLDYWQRYYFDGKASAAALASMTGSGFVSTVDRYDAADRLVSRLAVDGALTTWRYDAVGRQIGTSIDGGGHFETRKEYDVFGDVVAIVDGVGQRTTSHYDGAGRLLSTQAASGNTTWYFYDQAGHVAYSVQGTLDEDGKVNLRAAVDAYSYDAFGQVTVSTAYGSFLNLGSGGIDPSHATTAQMAAAIAALVPDAASPDRTLRYTYGRNGKVSKSVDGNGVGTTYEYDFLGRLLATERTREGQLPSVRTTFAYDALNDLISTTEAAGTALTRTTSSTYDSRGRKISSTDALGHQTLIGVNTLGLVTSTYDHTSHFDPGVGGMRGIDETRRTAYDQVGRIVSQTSIGGLVTQYGYDDTTRSTTVTTPEGLVTTTVRDAAGHTLSVTDPGGQVTTYRYDGAGRLVSTEDALHRVTTQSYGAGGQTVRTEGPDGTVLTVYDQAGRVLSRTEDPGGLKLTTRYAYDGNGHILRVTQPTGEVTVFTYDAEGHVLSQIEDAQGTRRTTTYTYDAGGHVLTSVVGAGADAIRTRYTYDALGRLDSSTVDPDGLALVTRYYHDGSDRLTATIDPQGIATYMAYDELGRTSLVITSVEGVGQNRGYVTQYIVGENGHNVATQAFDQSVDLTAISFLAAAGKAIDANTINVTIQEAARNYGGSTMGFTRYDRDGHVTMSVDTNGIVTEYRYDARGLVVETLHYPNSVSGYFGPYTDGAGWDSWGRRIDDVMKFKGNDRSVADIAQTAYDALGRPIYTLTGVTVNGVRRVIVTENRYGTDGRLSQTVKHAVDLPGSFLDTLHTVADVQAALATGDDSGASTTRFTYDSAGRLLATMDGAGGTVYNWYDASGRLAQTIDAAGQAKAFRWDGLGNLLETREASEAVVTTGWLDADGKPTAAYAAFRFDSVPGPVRITSQAYDASGRLVSRTVATATDAHGAPVAGERVTFAYDGASRLVRTDDEDLSGFSTKRVNRYFYDRSGHRIGTLDASGVLTTDSFDAAGNNIGTVVHGSAVDVALRDAASLEAMMPAASSADQVTTRFFNRRHKVVATIDAENYYIAYKLDAMDNVYEIDGYVDRVDDSLRASYDALRQGMPDYKGHSVVQNGYDAYGRLVRTASALGVVSTYQYDERNLLVAETDFVGEGSQRARTYTYDARGYRVSMTDGTGGVTTYVNDAAGHVIRSRDPAGNLTWYVNDANGRPLYIITGQPDGGVANRRAEVVRMTYDVFGHMIGRTRYGAFMDVDVSMVPDRASMDAAVAGLGVSAVDGNVTDVYAYDLGGHLVRKQEGGIVTDYDYDGFGQLLDSSVEGSGVVTAYAYDVMGRRIEASVGTPVKGPAVGLAVIDKVLDDERWSYDLRGDVTTHTVRGETDTYLYDRLGREISHGVSVDGQVRTESHTYQFDGRVATATDIFGQVTTYSYDFRARSVTVVAPGNIRTVTTSNGAGQVISVEDTFGYKTSYKYDGEGHLVSVDYVDGGHESRTYDADGNLALSVDAEGRKIAYTYDASGRLLTQTLDPDGAALRTITQYSARGLVISVTDPSGVVTRYSHDDAGNVLRTTIVGASSSGGDMVVDRTYDVAGRITGETRTGGQSYSRRYDLLGRLLYEEPVGGLPVSYAYDAEGNLSMKAEGDRRTFYFYDQAHEPTYTVETIGNVEAGPDSGYPWPMAGRQARVTQTTRNAQGLALTVTEYATPLDGALLDILESHATDTPASRLADLTARLSPSAADRVTYRAYDVYGRLAATIDPAGKVQEFGYEAQGRLAKTVTYPAAFVPSATLRVALVAGTATPSAIHAEVDATQHEWQGVTEILVYDRLGRVRYTVEHGNAENREASLIHEMRYDHAGRLVTEIAYDYADRAQVGDITYMEAQVTNRMYGHVTRHVFDGAGREVYTVSPAGSVTERQFDADGRVVSETTYANAVATWPSNTDVSAEAVRAAVAAANPSAGDRLVAHYGYDTLGHVISTSNGDTPIARYTYDDRGNRVSFTDAMGQVTTYTYDNLGRILTETAPSSTSSFLDAEGHQQIVTGHTVTRYEYDANGHVTLKETTAPGGQLRRTVTSYDETGNVLSVTLLDPGAIDGSSLKPTGVVETSYVLRDSRGNALVTRDAAGRYSYSAFDAADRPIYDVAADGSVTGHAYDSYGNETVTTRYSSLIDLSKLPPGWSAGQPIDVGGMRAAVAVSDSDRHLTSTYDRHGRKIRVQQDTIQSYSPSQPITPYVEMVYDAWGNQVAYGVRFDWWSGDADFSTTSSFFDADGHKTAEIDPVGYMTTWSYDGMGRPTSKREWAITTGRSTPGASQGSLPPPPAADPFDRVTTYTYDDQGRKASETSSHTSVDETGHVVHGTTTTNYRYDNAGRAISITQDGRVVATSYDELGRVHSVTSPSEKVLVDNWKELLVAHPEYSLTSPELYHDLAQVVTYAYDAFGNRTAMTQGASDGRSSTVTYSMFDAANRVVATATQAAGTSFDMAGAFTVRTEYDAMGRVVATYSRQTMEDGSRGTVATRRVYDLAGNLLSNITTGATGKVEHAVVNTYDVFGELLTTGNGAAVTSTRTYDRVGRLTSMTDPDTGVLRTYEYDMAGRVLRESTAVPGMSGPAWDYYTLDRSGNVVTHRIPDRVTYPYRTDGTSASYDRWGNVLSSQDLNQFVTTYQYDEHNRVIAKSAPAVNVVDGHGVATSSVTTEYTGYDATGAQTVAIDANGNVIRTLRDAAGQVVGMIDGEGVATYVAYDAFGHEVAEQSGSGHLSFKDVDVLGRVVREGDFGAESSGARTLTWRQAYVVDEAGNRLRTYDGAGAAALQSGDTATADLHATFYGYDSQGHMLWKQTGAQRAATLAMQANPPGAPYQPPRNFDLEQGNVAWTAEDQAWPGWNFVDGKAVYNGTLSTSRLTNTDRVTVKPGQEFNAWADVDSHGDHGGANVSIAWYDANDNYIGESEGNVQTTEEGRGHSNVTAKAPAGAAYARMRVVATNYGYANQVVTVFGTGWTYQPPASELSPGLDRSIFVNAPGSTFSMQPINPDFENGDSGWDKGKGWVIQYSEKDADNGHWDAAYTGAGISQMTNRNRAPVIPGQKITATGRIALYKPDLSVPSGALLIVWFDKDGNQIASSSSEVITKGNRGNFSTVSVTDVAPPGAAYASVALSGNGLGYGAAVFDAISWDYQYIPAVGGYEFANRYTYDLDGRLVAQRDADGNEETWTRDTYGRVVNHVDMSGASYQYTYDQRTGLLLSETDNWGRKNLGDQSRPQYASAAPSTVNTVAYEYNRMGQVTSITNNDGSWHRYAYDAMGRVTAEDSYSQDGAGLWVRATTSTSYDGQGRITHVEQTGGSLMLKEDYTYDAAGNRRSIVASTVASDGQVKASTTVWYTYDRNNRVNVSAGELRDGIIVVAANDKSYGMTYDADGNAAVRTTVRNGSTMVQRSTYNGRGQLVMAEYATTVGGPSMGVAELRKYDAVGNLVSDNQFYSFGATADRRPNPKVDPDDPYTPGTGVDIGGMLSSATITRYDAYGRVRQQQTFGHESYWNGAGGSSDVPAGLPDENATSYAGMGLQNSVLYQGADGSSAYDAMGNVMFYQYRSGSRVDQYTVTYLKKDSYLESATSGQNVSNTPDVRPSTDESYYNIRGERVAIAQHTQYAGGTVADTVRVFAYDGNGQIVLRRDGTSSDGKFDQGTGAEVLRRNQHFVYANGQQVARFDDNTELDVISQVTAFSSGTGTSGYVVQQGDTLKSIAQAVYGNASLWYVIAQANALTGDNDLSVGLGIDIPAVTTNKNDATTFKPYNPGEIQGSTTPELPVIAPPPPPPKQHCNVIAAVIVIAVAVVVSVVTYGAASGVMSSLAAAAVSGAAGSAASQVAGDVLGTHKGFSLGEVFTSAATAAVTMGVSNYMSTGSVLTSAQEVAAVQGGTATIHEATFASRAVEAAAGYATQSAASKLVGQPSHFSWAGLISNTVAAGIAGQIGPTSSQVQYGEVNDSAWRTGLANLTQGVVQRETSLALGDSHVSSWADIGASAAGTTLGTAIGVPLRDKVVAWQDSKRYDDINTHVSALYDRTSARVSGAIEAGTLSDIAAQYRSPFSATPSSPYAVSASAFEAPSTTSSVAQWSSGDVFPEINSRYAGSVAVPSPEDTSTWLSPLNGAYASLQPLSRSGALSYGGARLADTEVDARFLQANNAWAARNGVPQLDGDASRDVVIRYNEIANDNYLNGRDTLSTKLQDFVDAAHDRAIGVDDGRLQSALELDTRANLGRALIPVIAGGGLGLGGALAGGVQTALKSTKVFATLAASAVEGATGSAAYQASRMAAYEVSQGQVGTNHFSFTEVAWGAAWGSGFGLVAKALPALGAWGVSFARAPVRTISDTASSIAQSVVRGARTSAEALSTLSYTAEEGLTFLANGAKFQLRSPVYSVLDSSPGTLNSVVVPPIGLRSPVVRSGDVSATSSSVIATFGSASSSNYRATFFGAYPDLEGRVVVHHAVEQQVLTRYPGVVTEEQMHSLENLRGIPKEVNSDLHLSLIRREWNQFYRQNPNATQEQLLQKATEIDRKYGSQFNPPLGR